MVILVLQPVISLKKNYSAGSLCFTGTEAAKELYWISLLVWLLEQTKVDDSVLQDCIIQSDLVSKPNDNAQPNYTIELNQKMYLFSDFIDVFLPWGETNAWFNIGAVMDSW